MKPSSVFLALLGLVVFIILFGALVLIGPADSGPPPKNAGGTAKHPPGQ